MKWYSWGRRHCSGSWSLLPKFILFLGVDAEILSANALNLESMSAETVVTSKEGGGGLVIWSPSRGIKL